MSKFSPSDLSDYQENGFLIARSLFSSKEIDLLGETARADNAMISPLPHGMTEKAMPYA